MSKFMETIILIKVLTSNDINKYSSIGFFPCLIHVALTLSICINWISSMKLFLDPISNSVFEIEFYLVFCFTLFTEIGEPQILAQVLPILDETPKRYLRRSHSISV